MTILKIENIKYSYKDGGRQRVILNDLSYEFKSGKFYTIIGESGSGKTTFLSLIAGLEKVKVGKIYFNNKSLDEIGYSSYRRNDIALVFQHYNLINYLTAIQNITLAMSKTNKKIKKQKSIGYALLKKFGIGKSKADRSVTKLSGGEQQRVAIARALASNVDLILADEPTGNLDKNTEVEIIGIFKNLAQEFNKTIIVVTHSVDVCKQSDIVLKLVDGKFIEI